MALVAFALWPLAHRLLVMRYDLSPWRFFGWAMYCQPKIPIAVDAWVYVGGARRPLEHVPAEPHELSRWRFEFTKRREIWGTLAQPDGLARRILDAVPQAESVEIAVRHLRLDPQTARLRAREYGHRLYRDDLRM